MDRASYCKLKSAYFNIIAEQSGNVFVKPSETFVLLALDSPKGVSLALLCFFLVFGYVSIDKK